MNNNLATPPATDLRDSQPLLTVLMAETPFTLMKLIEAMRDNDVTRQYQEWKCLRHDLDAIAPYHEFIEEIEGDIDDAAEAAYDKWPRNTSEAVCSVCGDFDSNHMGICFECYVAQCRDEYLDRLIDKLKQETIVFTDGTAARVKDGIIQNIKLTAATNAIITVALSFGLGMVFMLLAFVGQDEIVDVSMTFWGVK